MAVSALWLFGLLVLAIGYSLTECLGAVCSEPAPDWVWWLGVGAAAVSFLASGRVAARMTGLGWTWLAGVPGLVFLVIVNL